jgi:hypothetical protein
VRAGKEAESWRLEDVLLLDGTCEMGVEWAYKIAQRRLDNPAPKLLLLAKFRPSIPGKHVLQSPYLAETGCLYLSSCPFFPDFAQHMGQRPSTATFVFAGDRLPLSCIEVLSC